MRRRAPILIGLMALVAIVAALALAPRTSTATGVVVAVEAQVVGRVDGFTISLADGETRRFAMGSLENATQFPPTHLLEHVASAVPVVVSYRDVDGTPTAFRIEDALPAGST